MNRSGPAGDSRHIERGRELSSRERGSTHGHGHVNPYPRDDRDLVARRSVYRRKKRNLALGLTWVMREAESSCSQSWWQQRQRRRGRERERGWWWWWWRQRRRRLVQVLGLVRLARCHRRADVCVSSRRRTPLFSHISRLLPSFLPLTLHPLSVSFRPGGPLLAALYALSDLSRGTRARDERVCYAHTAQPRRVASRFARNRADRPTFRQWLRLLWGLKGARARRRERRETTDASRRDATRASL